MKLLRFIACVLLAASFVSLLGACTPKPPVSDPDTESDVSSEPAEESSDGQEVEIPPRDVYEDLSFDVPAYTDPGTKTYSRREPNSYALRREFFASFAKSRLARCVSCFNSL